MCEIQYIQRLGEGVLTDEDINTFSELMKQGGSANKDAWGVYNSKKLYKESGEYTGDKKQLKTLKELAKGQSFLVGHNRLATQGDKKDNKNNHPFESKNYLLVHNGIISNDVTLQSMKELFYEEKTDSAIIIQLIQALKNKGFSTVKAIKKTTEMLEGSFSVLLYDKEAKTNYYFKNSKTQFSFGLLKRKGVSYLLGSTDEENFNYIYPKKQMIFRWNDYDFFLPQKAKNGKIYEISKDEIIIVEGFKERATTVFWNSGWGKYDYEGKKDAKELTMYEMAEDVKKVLDREGFHMTSWFDYPNELAYFKPEKKLSSYEETTVFTILENLCFYEESRRAFCMSKEDMESFVMMMNY